MENNVTFITDICRYAYNRTDIKSCKHECVCENVMTDLECGDLIFTIFCNKREDHDFSVAVYGSYGLVMIIAIATLWWHIKSGLFIKLFLTTRNDIKNHPDSKGPTFIAKFLTMPCCKTQSRSEEKDETNEQIGLTKSEEEIWAEYVKGQHNIEKGTLKVAWKWSRLNVQFWIKIISTILLSTNKQKIMNNAFLSLY